MAFFTPLPVDEEVENIQTELRMQAICEELKVMLLGIDFPSFILTELLSYLVIFLERSDANLGKAS